MKNVLVVTATALACCAAMGQSVAGDPPVRSVTMPTQKRGDLVVRGSITPAWHVPNESTGAVLSNVSPSTIPPVPARAGTAEVIQVPTRLNSREWRERIEFLEGQIQTRQRELAEAKASELVAIHSEQRDAEERIRQAQVLVEQLRAKVAAQMPVTPTAPVAAVVLAPVAPVGSVAKAAPTTPEEVAQVFQLRRDDGTISATLARWAEDVHYNILWEVKDEKASFNATYTTSFPDAVYQVLQGLNSAGVDARMCHYTNRVIRIVQKDIGCVITPNAVKTAQAGVAQ